VLSIGDSVTDYGLKERFQNTAGFLIDHWLGKVSNNPLSQGQAAGGGEREGKERTGRDTLDPATTGETTNSWLGDALDIVT
jgi:hypothetical protein